MMRSHKILQDAVHGMIELEPLALLLIDTPEFQRLREIRQLGHAHLVFPSCQHTRFEHSVGTYHMAKRLTDAIKNDPIIGCPEMTQAEHMAVKLAALCHDLGHGPFSHLWEHFIHRGGSKYAKYKHEKMSCKILDRIWQTYPAVSDAFTAVQLDVDLVKSLIVGEPPKQTKKPYVYEILHNNANGMDVDKWDYLLRDCLHAGLSQGTSGTIDVERFMRFCRPAPHSSQTDQSEPATEDSLHWHLSFRDTELENVLRTFGLRQYLHQTLYQHKTCSAIAQMVLDALDLIEPIVQLRETCWNALESNAPDSLDTFLQLQDSLLWDIYNRKFHHLASSQSDKDDLEQAHHLVSRIFTRQLYVYVDSVFEVSWNGAISDSACLPSSPKSRRPPSSKEFRSVVTPIGTREAFMAETLPSDCRIISPFPTDQLRIVNAYRLYWRGLQSTRKTDGPPPTTNLLGAFDQWHKQQTGDQSNNRAVYPLYPNAMPLTP